MGSRRAPERVARELHEFVAHAYRTLVAAARESKAALEKAVEVLWAEWEPWSTFGREGAVRFNSFQLTWQAGPQLQRTPERTYLGNRRWGRFAERISTPPNTIVEIHLGGNPGIVYLRECSLVDAAGRVLPLQMRHGLGAHYTNWGPGMIKVFLHGDQGQLAFMTPPQFGEWEFSANYYADLTTNAAGIVAQTLSAELSAMAQSSRGGMR
jgi:hypothetical protein